MIEFYPDIKFVHVLCVILSGSLFAPQVLRVLPPFLTLAEVAAAVQR